ncbi:hypothetical protein [Actinomadura sp. NTSP31]|uniref:hypothetical protein n=1 Tax=Actinomadura sp. NTSP31 TaxID=1735447 RepID=UPI0035C1D96C
MPRTQIEEVVRAAPADPGMALVYEARHLADAEHARQERVNAEEAARGAAQVRHGLEESFRLAGLSPEAARIAAAGRDGIPGGTPAAGRTFGDFAAATPAEVTVAEADADTAAGLTASYVAAGMTPEAARIAAGGRP